MKVKGIALLAIWTAAARAQNPGSLKNVPVPRPPGLNKYVRDPGQLVALGKALFWDMQAGSDGRTACASCHFHAGADHRNQNQLSNASGPFAVNQLLGAQDFPFHVVADPGDNRSPVVRDTASVTGSAGLFRRIFQDATAGSAAETGFDSSDTAFSRNGVNTRQVTARNTPTVINAVFNVRNFWDGRASSVFTGFTPFGDSDTGLNAYVLTDGAPVAERIRLENASLASQAVGPPMNTTEMSYDGRSWPLFGRKMLGLSPLAGQTVAPDDSVLGPLANPDGRGLAPGLTYSSLVQAAFNPEYWSWEPPLPNGFTQPEFNFALFWGLALHAYQSTLVSDDTRFDRFAEGDATALTADEQRGLQLFRSAGDCANCHNGPEFTSASFGNIARRGPVQAAPGGQTDTGYFRTGVRPIADDLGLGGLDTFGQPFSLALRNGGRTAVQGAFKTPGLRNVEFTGPYFHNGGQASLADVVSFYARGGDFPAGGVGPDIRRLNLNPDDRQSIVAFLKSLSDDRVRFERAPFDHPELCVPIGHVETVDGLQLNGSDSRYPLSAADRWAGIEPVGRNGSPVPLQTFEELLAGVGADGSRAHTLTGACAVP